ncbi:MAG TPA: CAP domain-containing protein [Acidimicrobiales bacterium]|nr:CAP domain-containing protein [Acidimicrobiales bacterium]
MLLGAAAPALGSGHEESEFLSRTNALRTSQGLSPLTVDFELADIARYWAAEMAAAAKVAGNPHLHKQATNWRRLGENVRRGPDVATIQAAFEADPRDAANLLDPEFVNIGIGVARAGSELFVTVDFKQPETLAAPPSPPAPVNPPPSRPPPDKPPSEGGSGGSRPAAPAVASSTTTNLGAFTLLAPDAADRHRGLTARPSMVLDHPSIGRQPRMSLPAGDTTAAGVALRSGASALFLAVTTFTALQVARKRGVTARRA